MRKNFVSDKIKHSYFFKLFSYRFVAFVIAYLLQYLKQFLIIVPKQLNLMGSCLTK